MKRCSLPWFIASVIAAMLLSLAGCNGGAPGTNEPRDAGCGAKPCDCCAEGEVCFEGQCCTPSCEDRLCGSDGCGGTCTGTCSNPNDTCNPATGKCECVGEDAATLCRGAGRSCGSPTLTDRCGASRTVDCGGCGVGETCAEDGHCLVCVNEEDTAFCARLEKDCGPVTGTDNCGDPRAVDDCGGCAPGFACTAATNSCDPCTSETDAEYCARTGGLNCGTVTGTDNCNVPRTFDCGTCTAPESCDGATNKCQPCVPEDDKAFCGRFGKECGPLTETDNCFASRTVQECGPCGSAAESCTGSGTCVLCTPEPDAELCGFYYKNCGTPALTDHCGTPRTPACGPGCTGALACQPNSVCGTAGVPTNDTCTDPERLVFDAAWTITHTGDLTGANDSSYGNCGGAGVDVVYVFDLSAPKILAVTVTPTGNGQPVSYVRQACTGWIDSGCGQSSGWGQAVSYTTRTLAAGTWYLVVDGAWGSAPGPFTLSITAYDPPPVPANDICATAQVLTFNAGVAQVAGDTTSAVNDYSDSCGWSTLDGNDVVYKFTLSAPAAVTATVTRDPLAPNLYPAVQLLATCPSGGTALKCGTQNSGTATAGSPNLAAGDYYVVVDGTSASYGTFTLEVKILPPVTNDLCSGALDIPLAVAPGGGSTDLVGSALGDTSIAADDYTSSCNYSTGNDLVYSFTLPVAGGPKNVLLEVTPTAGSLMQPYLFVKTDCAATDDLVCSSTAGMGQTTSATLRRLAPGTYYLFVDGWQTTSNGPFTIHLTASDPPPPPSNDVCVRAMPIALDPTSGAGQATGSTFAAIDDYAGSCGYTGAALDGPDMVYSVVLNSTLSLSARVTRGANAPSYWPAVYIQGTCGDTATEQACALGGGETATATAANLAPGTYYVIVDGLMRTAGDFTLEVFSFGALTNDTCASPTLLSFDANGDFVAHGDSCTVAQDTNSYSSGSCWGTGYGNDLVYKLVTTRTQNLELTFDPGHTAGSQIYLRTDCATDSSELYCNNSYNGSSALRLKNLPANTYYIWLDNNVTCGIFSFAAHLSNPPPVQSNDLCTSPQSVALDPATGVGTAIGDTDAATGDTDGSCHANSASELVYAFTLTAQRTVQVSVTPLANSALQPVLYLRSSACSAASEMACRAINSTGSAASLQFPRLAPATYYVFVDAWDRNASGAFDLAITTTDPGPVASNDLCASASAFPAFDPATHKASVTGNTLAGNDDDSSNCATTAAPLSGTDLVYELTLATATKITARLQRDVAALNFHPALSIRSSCSRDDEVACALDGGGGASEIASMSLAAGDWYLFVDGVDGSYGGFTLEIEDNGAAVAGDDCGDAIALAFASGASSVTVAGDLAAGALDHGDPSCSWGTGSDLVYRFTTTADAVVTATVVPQPGSGYRAVVSLRKACDARATELACLSNWNPGVTASVTTGRLPAGTYYVLVDSGSAWAQGPFSLTVDLATPATPVASNDTCLAPMALGQLDLAATGAVRVTGDTRDAFDDYSGTCATSWNPHTGGDLVYSFTLAQTSTVVAAVTRDESTPNYLPAVYLRRGSCASALAGDEKGCYTSMWAAEAAIAAPRLPAGDYWLIVDGQKSSAGKFTLDVAAMPSGTAASNTSCAAAMPLQLDANGVVEVGGDTTAGVSSTVGSPSCGSSGPELYYTFTTQATKNVTAEVIPGPSPYAPAVYIRQSCSDPATVKICDSSWGGVPLSVTALRLPADSYTVIVDSQSSNSVGPFVLRVTAVDPPPPPSYDTCRAPQSVTLPASGAAALVVTDTTLPASDDYTSLCATAADPLDGPDVVYSFTLATGSRVTAKVTPKATSTRYRPAVYLRSGVCELVGNNDLCAAASGPGQWNPAVLTESLPAGTYYLIVDGVGGTAGEFDLELSQDTAAYVEGDRCMNAKSLDALFAPGTAPTERVATVAGNTATASNDGDGSCVRGSGGDVFYSFTVASDSFVTVEVSPDAGSSYSPAFYVRSTCTDPTTELYCRGVPTGAAITGSLYHVAAGTYFLVLDSYTSWQTGGFTAHVSVRDTPLPPNNDTCLGALALPMFPTGSGSHQRALLVNQDSRFANDDTSGSCAPSAGYDVIYSFTVANTPASFSATVSPATASPDFTPVVYLRTVCDQSADSYEVACAKAAGPGGLNPVTISANSLSPGTYYLYVDAWRASPTDPSGGRFGIDASLDAPITGPANDSCAFAQTVPLTGPAPSVTTVTGQTTAGAVDNTSASCAPVGPDVVYRIDLAAASEVKVKVTPTSGSYYPAVYLRRTCGSPLVGNELACTANSMASAAVEASKGYLKAGTYFVWVDGGTAATAFASGAFDLEVTLSTPTRTPPANDLCDPTIPQLTQGVAVTGTTVDAYNDYFGINGGPCGYWAAAGPDVVYAYTPAADGPISVQLTSDATDLMPWMSEAACGDPSACVGANDMGGSGGIDSFTYPNGRAGVTYYIYVDSFLSTNEGTFTLVVN